MHQESPKSGGVRLQRVLADAGVAARRACEQLIESGRVEVNGEVVTRLPIFVDPEHDRISVDGRPIGRPERRLYVMLHKPTRTLSTAADEPGADRRTVTQLVDHPSGARLYPIGRLDYDATGLLLLTNDGALANRLTHPRYGLPQTYQAVVKGEPDEQTLAKLEGSAVVAERRRQRRAGKPVGDVKGSRVELRVVKRDAGRALLEITLVEGPNREVRHLLSKLGFPIKKLTRIAVGPLRLTGVPMGGWRELERHEIQLLRRAITGRGPLRPRDESLRADRVGLQRQAREQKSPREDHRPRENNRPRHDKPAREDGRPRDGDPASRARRSRQGAPAPGASRREQRSAGPASRPARPDRRPPRPAGRGNRGGPHGPGGRRRRG